MPRRWCTLMLLPIRLPELGAAPIVMSVWYARIGDQVFEGDRLVEVLAGSVTFDVPSPATGRLAEQQAFPTDTLTPGQTLGTVEVEEEG